jgi:hypothetical protein
MSEVWFDPETREILEYPYTDERVRDNAVVLPLGALLTTDQFPYEDGDFEKPNARRWKEEDALAIGKVAAAALENLEAGSVDLEHLSRLTILGLSPSPRMYRHFYATISGYRQAIGSEKKYEPQKYRNWSTANFIQYAQSIEAEVGRMPKLDDYRERARQGRGPSVKLIDRRIGNFSTLHEYLGYPNLLAWETEDYISWGIQVMRANPDKDFSLYVLDILSKRNRGPSTNPIYQRFDGGWAEFRQRVTEEGKLQIEAEEQTRKNNLEICQALIRDGLLPVEVSELSEDDLLSLGGRHRVVQELAADLSGHQIQQVLAAPSAKFITALRRYRPNLTAGEIELAAISNDAFDDIWPTVSNIQFLHVDQAEIDALRRSQNHKRQQRRTLLAKNSEKQ